MYNATKGRQSGLALQRKNWALSAALLATPLLFCTLLLVLQLIIQQQLDGPEFQCGCQCISCCDCVKSTGAAHTLQRSETTLLMEVSPLVHVQLVLACNFESCPGGMPDNQRVCFNATAARPCPLSATCKGGPRSVPLGAHVSTWLDVDCAGPQQQQLWPAVLDEPTSSILRRSAATKLAIPAAGELWTAFLDVPHYVLALSQAVDSPCCVCVCSFLKKPNRYRPW